MKTLRLEISCVSAPSNGRSGSNSNAVIRQNNRSRLSLSSTFHGRNDLQNVISSYRQRGALWHGRSSKLPIHCIAAPEYQAKRYADGKVVKVRFYYSLYSFVAQLPYNPCHLSSFSPTTSNTPSPSNTHRYLLKTSAISPS